MGRRPYPFRKAGADAPTLALAQSFWALGARELPIEKSLEQACAEGYEYLEAGLSEERMPCLRELVRGLPLRLIAQGWAADAGEATAYFDRAAELGAVAINFHLGHAFLSTGQAVALIGQVQEEAATYGLPLLLETHRGRLTQDLLRTTEIVTELPDLQLALDVSHYLLAGEGMGGSPRCFEQAMALLCRRAALLHGRITDGQTMQVRTNAAGALTGVTRQLWLDAMCFWLAEAPPGAQLVFEPELGPPPYAARDAAGNELWSRTEETKALVSLAREAWDQAQ